VGQLFPAFTAKETRCDDIIHLLASFNHPIKLRLILIGLSGIFKLSLKITVEYLHSFDQGFEVNVSGLGMF
jgi:hypothetical protein